MPKRAKPSSEKSSQLDLFSTPAPRPERISLVVPGQTRWWCLDCLFWYNVPWGKGSDCPQCGLTSGTAYTPSRPKEER